MMRTYANQNETTAVIEKLREIKGFDPLTYDAGNLIPLEQLQKVCENAETSYTYLEENLANIDTTVAHQQEGDDQIEEMLASTVYEISFLNVKVGQNTRFRYNELSEIYVVIQYNNYIDDFN